MDGFNFKFPLPVDGWEEQTLYSYKGPTVDDVQHYLMVVVDRHLQHHSIETFAKEKTSVIANSLANLEVVKEAVATIEGGNPTYEFIAKWVPHEKHIRFKRYLFVFSQGLGFTINCDFSKQTLGPVGDQMDKIIESLIPGTFAAQSKSTPAQPGQPAQSGAPAPIAPEPKKDPGHLW